MPPSWWLLFEDKNRVSTGCIIYDKIWLKFKVKLSIPLLLISHSSSCSFSQLFCLLTCRILFPISSSHKLWKWKIKLSKLLSLLTHEYKGVEWWGTIRPSSCCSSGNEGHTPPWRWLTSVCSIKIIPLFSKLAHMFLSSSLYSYSITPWS